MTDREKLQQLSAEIVQMARKRLGKEIGFAVLAFEFGVGGSVGYASNAKRKDMIEAMDEFIMREAMKGIKGRTCSSCGVNPARYIMVRCDLCGECHDAIEKTGLKIKTRKHGERKTDGPGSQGCGCGRA